MIKHINLLYLIILFNMSTYNVKDQKSLLELEAVLAKDMFIGGTTPNAQDALTFEAFENTAPDAAVYPGIAGWFYLVHYFAAVREQWKKEEPKKDDKKTDKKVEKKEEKKETKKDELDDMFEVDEEEDIEAVKARQARMKANLEKKKQKDAEKAKEGKAKAAVIAKSLIILDVKVWEQETDLDALAKLILAISMDGLVWKTEYKTPTVAFGMKKLVIGLVVEDDKVSVDDVIEQITAHEDLVQSVDIASFDKI